MNNTDHYLYINWEDDQKNKYRVGILARIADNYYLKTYARKPNLERDAYSHGFIGIPGFIPGELYKSNNQLFDFFKKRVYVDTPYNNQIDYLEELKQSGGTILTDSFSVEEIPENYKSKCKEIIIAMDMQQQRLNKKRLQSEQSK